MGLNELLAALETQPEQLLFADVIAAIGAHYEYTPQTFRNGLGEGTVVNAAGSNEGSCKVFAFGLLQGLDEARTLACFGEHYRAVLATPQGSDHGNIRAFMRDGWAGVSFGGRHCGGGSVGSVNPKSTTGLVVTYDVGIDIA